MRGSWAGWPKEPIKERECSSCGGTGFMAVVQPKELGRRIFPPRCPKCEGKGRIAVK
jgi:DnaJ-class molecular chaperone